MDGGETVFYRVQSSHMGVYFETYPSVDLLCHLICSNANSSRIGSFAVTTKPQTASLGNCA